MDDLHKSLKPLDAVRLRNMSATDIEINVHDKICFEVPHSEIFDVAMRWLNEHIKQDTITQNEEDLSIFVGMLHNRNCQYMAHYIQLPVFTLEQVDEAFRGWLKKDAVDDPAYTRRYLITQQDVHRMFTNQAEKNRKCLTDNEVAEIDKPNSPKGTKPTEKLLTEGQSGTSPHGAEPNTLIGTQEITSIYSSPREERSPSSTITLRRGRETTVGSESPEPSLLPKKYVCKRCDKPGHLLQQCPTNLDSRYDQAPPRGYRCIFCGRHGHHFATLCPKNPHETSLTKQREKIAAESQEPRTPNKKFRSHYGGRDSSTKRFRDRHRSRSPKQRDREYYRSRSPDRYQPRRPITSRSSPQDRNESDETGSRFSDGSEISPYTARARLTLKLRRSSKGSRSRDSSSHSGRQYYAPSSSGSTRSPIPERTRKGRIDLGKVRGRRDEGRLAYEDEVGITDANSPLSNSTVSTSSQCGISTGGGDIPRAGSSPTKSGSDDISKIRQEAEGFLSALAADITSRVQDHPPSVVVHTHGTKMEAGHSLSCEFQIDDSNRGRAATGSKLPAIVTAPGLRYGPVQCPPFSPKVVSLFHARENPIINIKANRKTASQMMNNSELPQIHRSKKADEGMRALSRSNII